MAGPRITDPVIEVAGRQWMTMDEAARRYGVSRPTIYRWRASGLPTRLIGRIRRVQVSVIAEWYREQTTRTIEEPTDADIKAAEEKAEAIFQRERTAHTTDTSG